jgi:hypothetical protein
VRKWLTRSQLHGLLRRTGFTVAKSYTAFPAGDRGILRWTNSRMLKRAASLLLPGRRVERIQERLGLGQYRIVVGRWDAPAEGAGL